MAVGGNARVESGVDLVGVEANGVEIIDVDAMDDRAGAEDR